MIPQSLKISIDKILFKKGYREHRTLNWGYLYLSGNKALAIDHGICEKDFEYRLYTEEQNHIVSTYDLFQRFVIDDFDDLELMESSLGPDDENPEDENSLSHYGRNRHLIDLDPTCVELAFEEAFQEAFGHEALLSIEREYPMLDCDNSGRFIDYVVHTTNGLIAIEQNGVRYHHPAIIGKVRYRNQLRKQNSICSSGIKLYRWATDSVFKERYIDDIKKYLGPRENLVPVNYIKTIRGLSILDHQKDILSNIAIERSSGRKAFLIVLPTGTGKTYVFIQDFGRIDRKTKTKRFLGIAGTKQLRDQLIQHLKKHQVDLGYSDDIGTDIDRKIVVKTAGWMSRHLHELSPDQFDYIAIDEAHHAVAPSYRKVIQYFNPETLIGLTATPERLDRKELAEVFGEYKSNIDLREAIENGLLAPIRVFRVESNIDLSEIRYNGKDYVGTDLQRKVIVPSRDELVVNVLKKYFIHDRFPKKSGIIFCVSVSHAESMTKLMRKEGICAEAVHGKQKDSEKIIESYQCGEIQFLCTCQLLNEGWDSPRTEVLVMARPTMSKVLYLQQLGRGTRKHPGKDSLWVIDVVDNYGALNRPWSAHAIFNISTYKPFGPLLGKLNVKAETRDEVIIDGLYEGERSIREIDVFTFEKNFPEHLSEEQLARELFINTGTLKSWIKKGDIKPDVVLPFGNRHLNYFAPEKVDKIRSSKGLKVRNEETRYEDFWEFIEKGDYVFSYKMIMMLKMLEIIDPMGECDLELLVEKYRAYYINRLSSDHPADRKNSPYNNREYLEDKTKMKRSLLENPFEKFERKRFMYHCKDLNKIAFSPDLWRRLIESRDLEKLKTKMAEDLKDYNTQIEAA